MSSGVESKMIVISDYINEVRDKFSAIAFQRVQRIDGMYVTNPVNKSSSNDVRIFTETQVKRALISTISASNAIKQKFSFFSQDEKEDVIYKLDKAEELNTEEKYAIQNAGHATQLIQVPGFNILTDPVFYDLNWVLYPAKTYSHPLPEMLPKIDIILISHNHPDHIDKTSLQNILKEHKKNGWSFPVVLVPMGDKKLIEGFGYKQVEETEWFTKISITKGENIVSFISIPADHRSGRLGYDHHKSLVTGWVVNPEKSNVIFKYSGDTRTLTDENQNAVDVVIWYEIQNKMTNVDDIPDIVCFEPSGPNYTRCDMDVTHQSSSYSILLKFIEAENLAGFSNRSPQDFIQKFKTVMMHHNKYEFGPDRFNEGMFIFKKLLLYMGLSDTDLKQELLNQKEKLNNNFDKKSVRQHSSFFSKPLIATLPEKTSILVHSKDFIIEDMFYAFKKVKGMNEEQIKHYFLEYLTKGTIFPQIGERLNNEQLKKATFDPKSVHKYNKKMEV